MQEPIITSLSGSRVELKFTLTPEEVKPYLDQAVVDLQTGKPIQGFRPGKAPYEEVKRAFGEMRIWETALERIVRARYVHTVLEKNLETVGSPAISVEQLVPGQDIKFTVTANVMPSVLTLAAYDKPLVTRKVRETKESDVEEALQDLRKMRRQEVATDRAATAEDMAMVDLEMKKDKVVLEGGNAKGYRVYLHEPHYIPGFTEQLMGVKKGEVKTFELSFPKDHYQKHLAGQPVEFTATVMDVYELKLPELDNEFAKGLGVESLEKLRALLKENIEKENRQKADESAEIELLDKMVSGSKFNDVPELLVNEEVRRMFEELRHAAEHQGMEMGDYLAQLKKTADEIKLEMVPQAIKRVQTAVLIKEVARREEVKVTDDELDAEIDRILSGAKEKEMRDQITSPDYRDYLTTRLRNRKALDELKKRGIEDK